MLDHLSEKLRARLGAQFHGDVVTDAHFDYGNRRGEENFLKDGSRSWFYAGRRVEPLLESAELDVVLARESRLRQITLAKEGHEVLAFLRTVATAEFGLVLFHAPNLPAHAVPREDVRPLPDTLDRAS